MLMGSPYGATDFLFLLPPPKMGKNTMKETLHCPGILGNTSLTGSRQNKLTFFRCIKFLLSYNRFFEKKNSSKMYSQRPNTMKETLHCPGISGKAF